ncbi:MAG: AAA family ATPase [Candidatus Heimdallarchaeota archaeon]|nr:AAA family ATPase [Candidatus Heimdallarchaeota archaeon]
MSKLRIKNFKSIVDLEIETKKYNIFIGEANSGKSNILETLGLLSAVGNEGKLDDFIRMTSLSNLFYDELYYNEIMIEFLDINVQLKVINESLKIIFSRSDTLTNDNYEYSFRKITNDKRDLSLHEVSYDLIKKFGEVFGLLEKIKYYILPNSKNYEYKGKQFHPPFGVNLFDIVNGSKDYRNTVKEIVEDFGYKLNLNPATKQIAIAKEVDGVVISYPIQLVADTIVSFISHIIAIESNENSILVFEEPEGHIFPHYIKELGEAIANDNTNSYFITSHNPYFLDTIIHKCNPEETLINLVYSRDFETKVKQLNRAEVLSLLRGDPFFSLNELIDEL